METKKANTMSKFAEMCNEVEKIDPSAAKWLREQPDEPTRLFAFERSEKGLGYCFIYALSPQGSRYWLNIERQLPPEYQ